MGNKDTKAIIAYCAPIVALALGAAFGLSQEEQSQLADMLVVVGSGIFGVVGVVGVIKSHKKKDKDQ